VVKVDQKAQLIDGVFGEQAHALPTLWTLQRKIFRESSVCFNTASRYLPQGFWSFWHTQLMLPTYTWHMVPVWRNVFFQAFTAICVTSV